MHCLTWSYKSTGEQLASKHLTSEKNPQNIYHQAARKLSTHQDAGSAETSLGLWHPSGCGD